MNATEFYEQATVAFGRVAKSLEQDHLGKPTPCDEWDVRALLAHIVDENLWVPPLLEGQTIEQVGNRFEGDMLGDDPVDAWENARAAGVAAALAASPEAVVHVSFGDITATEYLNQVATDHAIHAWDLATAIGTAPEVDADVVEAAYDYLAPQVDAWRSGGAFGPAVPVPPEAGRFEQLIGMTGRDPRTG